MCGSLGPLARRVSELRNATVAVFPAVDDHMPQALAEAMAAGAPVVATPIAAHQELVDHAVTGLLLRDRSLTDLRLAVHAIQHRDVDVSRIRASALRRVRDAYSQTSVVPRLIDILRIAA
jgi:glycosyltransferase involved in cell wall biosynthesis